MQYILNHEQMQACDKATIEHFGMPSAVLMERAALALAEDIQAHYPAPIRILVICGSGNNGGDGFAAARLLLLAGRAVQVLFAGRHASMTEETRRQAAIYEQYGGTYLPEDADFSDFGLIVDALFGIGLSRDVIGRYADLIRAVNRTHCPVVAADIPSGISADDGSVRGEAIRADRTVTFGYPKRGHVLYPGADYCGVLTVADIGIEDHALATIRPAFPGKCDNQQRLLFTYAPADLTALLPRRTARSNKGTYGTLLLIAGGPGMAGAAVLAGRAAARTGAGLIQILSHEGNRTILQNTLPEAVYKPWPEARSTAEEIRSLPNGQTPGTDSLSGALDPLLARADAVAIGPGLGQSETALALTDYILTHWSGPLVIDADALNLIAGHEDLMQALGSGAADRAGCTTDAPDDAHPDELCSGHGAAPDMPCRVITPHPGEMARLTDKPVSAILDNVPETAWQFAKAHNVICVLKDAHTAVSDGSDEIFLNLAGNNGMATAGSGDVLTGLIGGLLAQGTPPFDAACLGVSLHALSGDAAAKKTGVRSLTAGDLPQALPEVLASLT